MVSEPSVGTTEAQQHRWISTRVTSKQTELETAWTQYRRAMVHQEIRNIEEMGKRGPRTT